MTFIYYSADHSAIHFLPFPREDHGVLIGSITELPKRPAFVVQSLLTNAGFHDITGLTFVHGERLLIAQEIQSFARMAETDHALLTQLA